MEVVEEIRGMSVLRNSPLGFLASLTYVCMLDRGDVDSPRKLKADVENYVLLSTSINQNQMRTLKHTFIRSH